MKLKKGEVVFFSWATYKSKAHRNRVMEKVMRDPRLASFMSAEQMPFDGMRRTRKRSRLPDIRNFPAVGMDAALPWRIQVKGRIR